MDSAKMCCNLKSSGGETFFLWNRPWLPTEAVLVISPMRVIFLIFF